MQKVQDLAIQNYNENMQYFKDNHETLHNKLLALDTLLNEEAIKQKYDLEYKNNYFDVIELKSGNFLYSQNSDEYGTKLCDEISMKKSEQVCQTFLNLRYEKDALELINKSTPVNLHANLAAIFDYYDKNVDSNMQFRQIEKFMFLGLGLATHVQKIMDRFKPMVVLLVEDDLELFRLSLFTSNYKEILSNVVAAVFSVGENAEEFNISLTNFYSIEILSNQYLKFSLFSDSYQNKVKSIQEFVVSRPEKGYSHNMLMLKNQKVLQRIHEKYNFLELTKKVDETFFKDKPVIVIGAGPSLHENIEWLLENKDKFIIISVFSALKTLQKYNISPDIAIQYDEATRILDSFDNFEFLDNSMFLFTASIADIFLEKFDSKNIFLFEDRTHYKQKAIEVRAASVGELAYSISLILNTKDTYLLGLDFALNDDGSTHAKDHAFVEKIDTSVGNEISTSTSLTSNVLKIKGNFKDSVLTTPLLNLSIPLFNKYTKRFKSSNQNVYNLCDGAYLKDTIALKTKDIKQLNTIDKKEISSQINKILTNYSTSQLNKDNIKLNKEQIPIIRKFIENFENSPTTNIDSFTISYKIMFNNLIQLDKSNETELKHMLLIYLFNTSGYIVDFFNTKELEQAKKHTKKLKKIITTELNKIIDYYEDIINKNT